MSFIYNYQYEQSTPRFECEDGEQLVVVKAATVTTSKNGSQMVKVGLDVSNSNGFVYFEHFVEGEFFNRKMSQFFDAFCIQPGNFNFQSWIGKKGYAIFAHREETWTNSNGVQQKTNRAFLHYFIPRTDEKNQGPSSMQPKGTAPGRRPFAEAESVTTDQLDNAGVLW